MFFNESGVIALVQGWTISGPRATCGPRKHSGKSSNL